MPQIMLYIFVLLLGGVGGFLLQSWMTSKFLDISGVMEIKKDSETDRILYSLILNDDPENLEFKKLIIFEVVTPEENLNRD